MDQKDDHLESLSEIDHSFAGSRLGRPVEFNVQAGRSGRKETWKRVIQDAGLCTVQGCDHVFRITR